MYIKTTSNLAMHGPLLSSIHPNFLSICGTRSCNEDQHLFHIPPASMSSFEIPILSMVVAGTVEHFRLKYKDNDCPTCEGLSPLSIFWQVPQYVIIGASEVFMYLGWLEFFNGEAPDGQKSFGSALCMTTISLGNYVRLIVSRLLVTIVMKVSSSDRMTGWIPGNLNKGHLDNFYFLLAILTSADFVVYLLVANWHTYIKFEGRNEKLEGCQHV